MRLFFILALLLTGLLISGFQSENSKTLKQQIPQTSDSSAIDSTYEEILETGWELFNKTEYERAITHGKRVARFINPEDTTTAKFNILIGESYLQSNKVDSSLVFLKKAEAIMANIQDGNNLIRARSLHDIGLAIYRKGKHEESLKYYKESLKIKKNILGDSDLKLANTYNNIGNSYNRQDKFETAIFYYKKSLELCTKEDKDTKVKMSDYYLNIGWAYNDLGQYELAMEFSKKSLAIRLKQLGSKHEKIGESHNNIGLIYLNKSDYSKAEEHLIKALEIKKISLGKNHVQVARGLYNLSLSAEEQGRINEALTYRLEALKILSDQLGENHPVVGVVTNGVAVSYKNLGEYDLSLEYSNKVFNINKENFGLESSKNVNIYYNIGNIFYTKGKNKEANKYFDLSLDLSTKHYGADHSKTLVIQSGIAQLFVRNKNYQEAISMYEDILSKRIKKNGPKDKDVATTYEYLGTGYEKIGDYEKALFYLNKSLDIKLETFGEKHPKVSSNYLNTGVVHFREKRFDIAIDYFRKALNALTEEGVKENDFSKFEDLKKLRLVYSWIQKVYREKAKSDDRYLDSLANQYQLALSLEAFTQKHHSRLSTRQFYMANSISTYEGAIDNLLARNKPDDLSAAFTLSEKTKSRYLSEKLQSVSHATTFGLPDTLREKEHDLNVDIAYFEKKKFDIDYDQRISNDSLINIYENQLFELNQKRDQLLELFKTKFPDYYNLRYSQSVLSAKEIQNSLLQQNQSLIEYFVGDSSIYTFLITKETFQVRQTEIDFPLQQQVAQLRQSVYAPFTQNEISQKGKDSLSLLYPKVAYQLYQKLIQPVEGFIPEQSELIIIPDGILGYIPFDALLTAPVESVDNHRNYPYLLKRYQTSIAYSATLLKEMRDKKHRNIPAKNFLAVAPSFPGEKRDTLLLASRFIDISKERNRLGTLNFNIPEVKDLQSIMGGDLLIDSLATENAFVQKASDYRILHLSTHGKANDQEGDYSFLAFYEKEDSLENEWLYNRELYELDLNADMVVLSACETGIGELQRGEGIISLARGFSYAGAKSIITSLWSVNDQQTPELMKSFYAYLQKGESKDSALRKAKLDYLAKSTNPEPYFWASFISIGDMSPIELDSAWPWWGWALIAIGALVLFFGYRRMST